jgi:hypothetical protein
MKPGPNDVKLATRSTGDELHELKLWIDTPVMIAVCSAFGFSSKDPASGPSFGG